jgi:hypothetical protein
MASDQVVVATGALTAAAGILGAVGGAYFAGRFSRATEREARYYDARRETYERLLVWMRRRETATRRRALGGSVQEYRSELRVLEDDADLVFTRLKLWEAR